MANTFELAQKYLPLLDEEYKASSRTAILDATKVDIVNGNTIKVFKTSMDGLGNYDRNKGYTDGEVAGSWETLTLTRDRGRAFMVDRMDNEETIGMAFGTLAGEFIRTKVVPELDAFRFAEYASASGISTATGSLASGANVVTALREAVNEMDEGEVPVEERYLFITPTLGGMVDDLDTTKSRAIMSRFAKAIYVPQTRFYTAITQSDNGFTKAGNDINFMIVHKPAVIQFQKHVAPKVITPEQNQNADAWKFGYRNVGIAEVYDNKVAGIFVHHKA